MRKSIQKRTIIRFEGGAFYLLPKVFSFQISKDGYISLYYNSSFFEYYIGMIEISKIRTIEVNTVVLYQR